MGFKVFYVAKHTNGTAYFRTFFLISHFCLYSRTQQCSHPDICYTLFSHKNCFVMPDATTIGINEMSLMHG